MHKKYVIIQNPQNIFGMSKITGSEMNPTSNKNIYKYTTGTCVIIETCVLKWSLRGILEHFRLTLDVLFSPVFIHTGR